MSNLTGQIALVTGAGRGLGRGIALVLAEQGAHVAVNDLDAASAARTVADIEALGRRSVALPGNVRRADEVARVFAEFDRQFEKLDILVNNAGTAQARDIFEIDEDDWEFILDTNLGSCYRVSKAAMERMREHRGGRIVNISSVSGEQGALFGHVHYSASKAGMLGFTKSLARTGAPLGITVNAVAPGIIDTELLRKTHGDEEVATLAGRVPLGLGRVRDVGLAVAFLCGEGGRYITGATLDVNGGLYMR